MLDAERLASWLQKMIPDILENVEPSGDELIAIRLGVVSAMNEREPERGDFKKVQHEIARRMTIALMSVLGSRHVQRFGYMRVTDSAVEIRDFPRNDRTCWGPDAEEGQFWCNYWRGDSLHVELIGGGKVCFPNARSIEFVPEMDGE